MKESQIAAARGIDVRDPQLGLSIGAERLSIVRYVFLVQIEDGIASADQRAALEYADAVLMGWPEGDAGDIQSIGSDGIEAVQHHMDEMESYIAKFSHLEREGDVDAMGDALIRVTERVAEIRRLYQPGFLLPTFAEIRRVVQEEWDEDMGKIASHGVEPTAEAIEEETQNADRSTQDDGAQDPAAPGGATLEDHGDEGGKDRA